jgi:hypothetical protein
VLANGQITIVLSEKGLVCHVTLGKRMIYGISQEVKKALAWLANA